LIELAQTLEKRAHCGPDYFHHERAEVFGDRWTPIIMRERHAGRGLLSYGPDNSEFLRQVGSCTGRILKDEKPAELPIIQPTKFGFVINLKTAEALGLQIRRRCSLLLTM
jgi:hypothetical protein